MNICLHPDCNEEVRGRHGFLCTRHYFQLSANEARAMARFKIKADKAEHPEQRQYLQQQFNSYIRTIFRRINPNQKESSCVS